MTLVEKNSTGSYKVYDLPDGKVLLKSYGTPVALKEPGIGIILDEKYWDYSVTTARHVGIFLQSNAKIIRERIKDGVIKLDNLYEKF